MNTIHPDALTAKVTATNAAHAKLIAVVPQILAAIAPFHGQKVELASGGLSKKFSEILDPFREHSHACRVYFDHSGYSLRVSVDVSADHYRRCGNNFTCSQRGAAYFYLANVHGGILGDSYEFKPDEYRTDFTPEAVSAVRAELEAAKKALSAIQSRLHPFGEYEQNA